QYQPDTKIACFARATKRDGLCSLRPYAYDGLTNQRAFVFQIVVDTCQTFTSTRGILGSRLSLATQHRKSALSADFFAKPQIKLSFCWRGSLILSGIRRISGYPMITGQTGQRTSVGRASLVSPVVDTVFGLLSLWLRRFASTTLTPPRRTISPTYCSPQHNCNRHFVPHAVLALSTARKITADRRYERFYFFGPSGAHLAA